MHSELNTAKFVLLVHSTIEGATLHLDKLPRLPPGVNLDWYHSLKLIKIKDEHKHIAYSTLNAATYMKTRCPGVFGFTWIATNGEWYPPWLLSP